MLISLFPFKFRLTSKILDEEDIFYIYKLRTPVQQQVTSRH
jgi:hypothetical protein